MTELKHSQEQVDIALSDMLEGRRTPSETVDILVEHGMDREAARAIVQEKTAPFIEAQKKDGQRDILWGSVWCIGGLIATIADFGYVFWGAIVFGGIQLIRGIIAVSHN